MSERRNDYEQTDERLVAKESLSSLLGTGSNHVEASIVLICGIPGSGKSTLADGLVAALRKETGGDALVGLPRCDDGYLWKDNSHTSFGSYDTVMKIDYDEIEDDNFHDLQKRLDPQEPDNTREHENIGKGVLPQSPGSNKVNDSACLESDSGSNKLRLQAWRNARKVALDRLDKILHLHSMHSMETCEKKSLLIILDDNFYLRSMRRDVYRVCQQHVKVTGKLSTTECKWLIGFSTVFMDIPVAQCLERNAQRSGRACVPDEVIKKMSASFEYPDAAKGRHNFERNCVLLGPTFGSMDDAIHLVKGCIEMAKDHRVIPPEENSMDLESLERERERTRANKVHRIDQILRKLVGITCKIDRSRSRKANNARKIVLDEVKTGICSGSNCGPVTTNMAEYYPHHSSQSEEHKVVLERFLTLALAEVEDEEARSDISLQIAKEFLRTGQKEVK